MGQALYRKYRTTSLAETPGQEHITTALQHALDSDRISHAYLFTGPRGVGKTSIARIMAYAINNVPYSTDPHLDIIEIDAASNRRIDEIRDLRDKVHVAPASARYKVYIIDEVHMLTREAFNALLKTLEEPPAHVVFILATTDAHKLPETIVSRTQRYNFKPIDTATAVKRLRYIAKQEKIDITDEALELLALHGGGSFRDSISLLDQASNQTGQVDATAVRQQLGIPPTETLKAVVESLQADNVAAPVMAVQQLYDQGYRAITVAEQLSALLRAELAGNTTTLGVAVSLQLLEQLLSVPASHNPERALELLLMQAVDVSETTAPAPKPVAAAPRATPKPAAAPTAVTTEPTPKPAEPEAPPEPTPPKSKPKAGSKTIDETVWGEVLGELKKQYNTIYGIVRMAQTDFSTPGKVSLTFAFAFHQKRISDAKNRKIVTDTIEQVTGQRIELVCSVNKDAKPSKTPLPANELSNISSVFGGGELL